MPNGLHEQLGALIQKAQAGDKEAFAQFFVQTSEIQYHLILTYVNETDAAQDILQEVYLTLYQNLANIRRPQSVIAYLNTTTHQVCMNYRRRAATRSAHSVSPTTAPFDVTALSLAEQAEYSEQLVQLRHALKKLTSREQQVILMRYAQRLKISDIATALELSPATVKRLHHSALKKLRKDMMLPAFVPLFLIGRKLCSVQKHPLRRKTVALACAGALSAVAAACLAVPVSISHVEIPTGLCPADILIQVQIESAFPMRQVTLYGPKGSIEMQETSPGIFSAFLPDNGKYTVKAVSNNGRTAQTSFNVDNIDPQPPVLEAWVEDGLTLIQATDNFGVQKLTCVDGFGTTQPLVWQQTDMWAFRLADGEYTCTATDGAGNTASYTLQVQLPQG